MRDETLYKITSPTATAIQYKCNKLKDLQQERVNQCKIIEGGTVTISTNSSAGATFAQKEKATVTSPNNMEPVLLPTSLQCVSQKTRGHRCPQI